MLSTYTSYQIITRDIDRSINTVSKQPVVERETAYFLENISKVKTIDEFVDNSRLFNYAMKAHGLGDMAYAKAFMVKALKEGIGSEDSFANKLTDRRYAAFVESFNFHAFSENATTYNPTQKGTVDRFTLQAVSKGVAADSPALKAQNAFYAEHIAEVKSADDLLKDDFLYSYALKAFGLDAYLNDKDAVREFLDGGVAEVDSPANKASDANVAKFVTAFNFEAYGETTTTRVLAQQPTIDKFFRQTLEENAGNDNEGVRLALYFERNVGKITDAYTVLADTALSKVVRTALGLPDSFATADIDRQADTIANRLDFDELKEPEGLAKFMNRFTSMWEISNRASTAAANVSILFSQGPELGVSTDLMLTLQGLKLGGI